MQPVCFLVNEKKNEATTIITKSASDALGSAERAVNYSVEQNLTVLSDSNVHALHTFIDTVSRSQWEQAGDVRTA